MNEPREFAYSFTVRGTVKLPEEQVRPWLVQSVSLSAGMAAGCTQVEMEVKPVSGIQAPSQGLKLQ